MGFDTVFDFEQDFAKEFQCIPLAVRYKLDVGGIKLSLRQWRCFTQEDHRDLLLRKCETSVEIAHYRDMLAALIASRAGEAAKFLPVEAAPAWANLDAIPDQIIAHARTLSIGSPTLAEWQSLSVLQRFALMKLSRDSHDNENFIPALREFELLPALG